MTRSTGTRIVEEHRPMRGRREGTGTRTGRRGPLSGAIGRARPPLVRETGPSGVRMAEEGQAAGSTSRTFPPLLRSMSRASPRSIFARASTLNSASASCHSLACLVPYRLASVGRRDPSAFTWIDTVRPVFR